MRNLSKNGRVVRFMNASTGRILAVVFTASGMLASPGMVLAQTAAAANPQAREPGDEIIVSARRQQESVQDVPVTVSAFSGEQLQNLGVVKSTDIAAITPNFTINSGFGASNPMLYIRGVGSGNFNDNSQANVGTYIDDVYLSAPAGKLLQMFDVESVQVLKGPQGTLFGRNNTAGALVITSRLPRSEFEGYVRGGVASFNTLSLEGAVSIPVSSDFGVRVAVQRRKSDGYGEFIDATGKRLDKLGRVDEFAGRMIAHYEGENLTATLNISRGSANNDRPPVITNPIPGPADFLGFTPFDLSNKYQNQANFREIERVRTFGSFLNLKYDFGSWDVTSITGYWFAKRFITLDVDHSPLNTLHVSRDARSKQFSQELRLASSGERPLSWVIGGYFFSEKLRANNLFAIVSASPDPSLYQNYTNDTTSVAGFAEVIWRFAEGWSLTGGLRGTYDKREFTLALDPGLTGVPGGVFVTRKRDWFKPSWRAIVDYHPNDDVMLYGSISRGFQGGGFNGGALSATELGNGFEPEFLTAYEVGTKTQFFDRRLTANLSLFYYDYKKPQVFAIDVGLSSSSALGLVQTITNADSARLYGLDFDMRARITSDFRVNFGAGYVKSKYKGLTLVNQAGTVVSGDGNPLIDAPKWTLMAGADLDLPVGNGKVTLHGDYSYTSRRYYDITGRVSRSGDPYSLVNARISFTPDNERFNVALYARNLTDARYLSYIGDVTSSFGLQEELWGAPRSFGGELTVNF